MLLASFCLLAVALACLFLIFPKKDSENREAIKQDLIAIQEGSFNSVFFSMFPITGYQAEDFRTYRGVDPILSTGIPTNLTDLSTYLNTAFASGNTITNIYLGLDPYAIWQSCDRKSAQWTKDLETRLLPYFANYPDISFEIMLPSPSLEYWLSLKEDKTIEMLATYRTLITSLSSYPNVSTYFTGAEYWLIANPDSYLAAYDINSVVARKLMLFTFCDKQYQISNDNADELLGRLSDLLASERQNPTSYPDLSHWQLVFFGDSIIGNYSGSFSIPGVVSGLSKASTYNYAIGGTHASDIPDYDKAFLDRVKQFSAGTLKVTHGEENFAPTDDQRLCFVVHYGLNDYFSGLPVENKEFPNDETTYAGSLRTGIQFLQENYPDATIIVMTPPFCALFENGTERKSEQGGLLTDYVEAAKLVVDEMNAICMDNYSGLGIHADNQESYLEDGCHLNETGRFLLGAQLIEILAQENDAMP
ncbi:MAG: hypothetical protein IJF07_00565 [Lachnospiraceae bacterium]|nr:hypothetical protein [Lachnospiraceae bacterium]